MAEVHIFEKETDAALEILDRALVIASEANDMPALLRIAERAAAIAPDDMERAIVHAEFLAAKGDLERARPIATAAAARLERESNDTLLVRAFGVLRLTDPRDARVAQRFADALERLGQPEAAEEIRLEGARLLLEARQFDRAESELRLILERFPSNTDALRMLAEVLAKSGRAAEATEVSVSLAATLRKAGSTDASRRLLESLLAHDPNNLAALAGLSDLCEELGDEDGVVKTALRMIAIYKDRRMYDDAIEQAKMALELRPNDPAAIKELVDLYDLKGDRAKMAEAMLRRVDALRRAGDRSGERDALVAILVREPRNRPALERLAFLHFELGERTEGLARLDEYTVASPVPDTVALVRELLLRNPEDTGLHLRLVSLLRKTGDRASLAAAIQQLVLVYERQDQWKDAVGLYREVLTLLPDSVMTRVSLVEALKRIGDRAGAIAELHELAKEHQAKGNDDDAMQAFDHVLRIDEFNEAAYRGQAQVLRRRGRNDLAAGRLKAYAEALRTKGQRREAVRTLRSVFEFDEANMDVRRTLVAILQEEGRAEDVERELLAMAEIQQAAGDTEGAVASIREAVSLRPGVPALRRRLVQALEASGRSNEAQAESLSLAEALFAEKKIAESRKTVEELIARNPENVRARRLRAEILVASGDEKAALEEFRAMSRQLDRIEVVGTLNREEPPTAVPLSILRENSFESFVAGPGNNFALATAKAVAKSPGTTDHNPLFLYSDVGLGKTHLLHAIANLMMDRTPGTRVNYTNAEDFTSELVDAIQNGTVNEFRNRHKGADILLLDDVQFLAGKERSQEEFFHIFNTLYQAKKQIAITSDRPPKDIAHLEKRLRSRFGAGVVVDIQPPDMETRIAILRRELRQRYADVEIVDEAILRIAERVDTNIRDLKGILNQAVLRRRVKGEEVTVAVVDDIVSRLYATK
jgi:chromosomal replication initiator protein DnaA